MSEDFYSIEINKINIFYLEFTLKIGQLMLVVTIVSHYSINEIQKILRNTYYICNKNLLRYTELK